MQPTLLVTKLESLCRFFFSIYGSDRCALLHRAISTTHERGGRGDDGSSTPQPHSTCVVLQAGCACVTTQGSTWGRFLISSSPQVKENMHALWSANLLLVYGEARCPLRGMHDLRKWYQSHMGTGWGYDFSAFRSGGKGRCSGG